MTALHPREVDRKIREIKSLIEEIQPQYWWAHGFSYGPTRQPDSIDGGAPPARGSVSDQTGGIATSTEKALARRALVNATDTIEEAIAALKSARYVLDHAMPDREPMPSQMLPAMVTRAELADSRGAKVRREAAGRGWGEA